MPYLNDFDDVQFNLFEYLKIQDLSQFDNFTDQNEELYKMVLETALSFSQNEIAPLMVKSDQEGTQLKGGQVIIPSGFKEVYQQYAQNGFLGMDVAPEFGGQGLPAVLMVASFEFFTGACVAFSMYPGLTRGAAHVIESFADSKLSHLICPKMYDGSWAGTMCLTEPQAGSSVGDVKTTAEKNEDGTYNIVGNKIFISSGDHNITENIIHLVLARVKGDAEGTRGISLFIVPKYWFDENGVSGEFNDVSCVNVEHKMGIKGQATCSLNFGENNKCRGYLVGEQSKGMAMMFQLMNEARVLTGMQGMAISGNAYEHARAYAKERIQGKGKAIIEYPDVKRNLSLSKSMVEGMRALLLKTAHSVDLSRHHPDDKEREKYQDYVDLMVPICKAFCSDQGFRVTELAIQVYGGYGYISEYPVEQMMRDCKISSIYEGTNGIQALDLLGRKLTLKQGQLFRSYYENVDGFIKQHIESELKDALTLLKKSLDQIAATAMEFAKLSMGGELKKAMLNATPFLEMCGYVVLGHLLLEQAVLGLGKEEVFYKNKIKTAKFFAAQFLPLVVSKAKTILSGDASALEIEF